MPPIALVTGGAGFIGSHIVDALLQAGYAVRVLDDLSSGRRDNLPATGRVTLLQGDIGDRTLLARAVDGVDVIFHLAAQIFVARSVTDPESTMRVNADGTLRLLQAAAAAGVRRLVLSSTAAIYGSHAPQPTPETALPAPESPYAISKLTAEQLCRFFNDTTSLETVALRYFNIYGPRQVAASPYSGVISIFVDRLHHDRPVTIHGDGEQTRDFVYVADAVRANLLAATTPAAAGQVINIGGGRTVTINGLYDAIAAAVGSNARPAHGPRRAGDVRHSRADVRLARELLGWEATVPLGDGLARLVSAAT